MYFRLLFALILLALLRVGQAEAQGAQQVITGYSTTSGCPSAATTPCFVQFGAGGGGGGGNVVITGPLGQALMAASIPVVIASNQSNVPVSQATASALNATVVGTGTFAVQATVTGATSNASSAVATSSTNAPTVAYNYGFNGSTWDQLQVDTAKSLKVNPIPLSTPAAATASAIVTGGAATTLVTGPVNGCYITNPLTLTDQNIAAAEVAYVNPVTTATANGRGTNAALQPGQTFYCVPGQTTNVSAIAATTAHAFNVVKW